MSTIEAVATRNEDELVVEEPETEAEDLDAGPPTYDLTVYPADFTLEILASKFEKGEIQVPTYQRKFVWDVKRASKLVESFLMGLPVPPIFLYGDPTSEALLVVDGNQRLSSVHAYFTERFPNIGNPSSGYKQFRLVLAPKNRYNGKSFNELEIKDQRKLKNNIMRAIVIRQNSSDDQSSIYEVFERLNTGGMSLSPQEVRNCVADGDFNALLHALNSNQNWRSILGVSIIDRRLRDVELVLRCLALTSSLDDYEKPLKVFLNKFMQRNKRGENDGLFFEQFSSTVARIVEALGPKPFHIIKGINAAILDATFVAVTRLPEVTVDQLRGRFPRMKEDEELNNLLRSGTSDEKNVRSRIEIACRILSDG